MSQHRLTKDYQLDLLCCLPWWGGFHTALYGIHSVSKQTGVQRGLIELPVIGRMCL